MLPGSKDMQHGGSSKQYLLQTLMRWPPSKSCCAGPAPSMHCSAAAMRSGQPLSQTGVVVCQTSSPVLQASSTSSAILQHFSGRHLHIRLPATALLKSSCML